MNKNLTCTTFFSLAAISLTALLFSCHKTINTNDSKYFTKEGKCTAKLQEFTSQQPKNVKFYIEASGSMNGFFRSNQATKFKHDVWSVITDFTPSDGNVYVFAEQNAEAHPLPVGSFRDGMNKGLFVSSTSTDVPDMLSKMLDSVDYKSSEVGVLISDMKYDPVGNSAIKPLISQYSTDIRNIMMRHPDVGVCLIAATSEYLGKDGNKVVDASPYYYLIVGNKTNVVYMRNFIATLLRGNSTFVDEIEWGIDYLTPPIKVSDADYLTEIDANKSYGDFNNGCTITLDVDVTNFPWFLENKDSLFNRLSISSAEGTEARIDKKNIKYDISNDDGKQLKRTIIAKVPVKIGNMFVDSDVFEISLNCPEIQMPNNIFTSFLGSQDVNDLAKTFSIEGLLGGFYSSMERYKKAHPVHILISKN